MTETINGKHIFNVYLELLVWPMSYLLIWLLQGFWTHTRTAPHQEEWGRGGWLRSCGFTCVELSWRSSSLALFYNQWLTPAFVLQRTAASSVVHWVASSQLLGVLLKGTLVVCIAPPPPFPTPQNTLSNSHTYTYIAHIFPPLTSGLPTPHLLTLWLLSCACAWATLVYSLHSFTSCKP